MIYYQNCVNELTKKPHFFPDNRGMFASVTEGFPSRFFSMEWGTRVERSREDFEAQFSNSFKECGVHDHSGYEDWLDGLAADDDVGGMAYAKFCHKFVIPPKFTLKGLEFHVLDPRCPFMYKGPDMAGEFVSNANDLSDEDFERLEKLYDLADGKNRIHDFIPKYRLPWHEGQELEWDSHWWVLLDYLIKRPALTSALFGI